MIKQLKRPAPLTCTDNTEKVRCGFLWLKTKTVEISGLTRGKVYQALTVHAENHGSAYVNYSFVYYLVQNDNGIMQLYSEKKFNSPQFGI